MKPGGCSAHASGDDGAEPSTTGGGDSDVVLRSVARHVIAKIAQSSREQGGPTANQGYTIENFSKMNPPVFSGGANPKVAKNWMQEIKKILMVLYCTDEQRVLYVTYKLTVATERWWTTVKLLEEQRPIPVGQLTVQQYATKFIKLSHFAPYIVPDKLKKARMFERGLRHDIHRQVVVLKMQDFSKLVDRATIVKESNQRDMGTSS
ncbi:uncharacterized protein LOC131160817 [Malania oleifera]|uniref:uncharacterized protein LOC131160817 n=1 Tax=Malania oleifera TaxID=397392 RepID=UPI0025AE7289|nr:uncharacterized protein LOC131160817 [Malania oleifera]